MNVKSKVLQEIMDHIQGLQGRDLKMRIDGANKPKMDMEPQHADEDDAIKKMGGMPPEKMEPKKIHKPGMESEVEEPHPSEGHGEMDGTHKDLSDEEMDELIAHYMNKK